MLSRYFLCIIYIIFSVSGLIIIKMGNDAQINKFLTIPLINLNLSWLSVIGIICYGISFCLYLGIIANYKIGIIIPILGGIVNIAILAASTLLFKEQLGIKSIIGALIIIVGIVIMNI